MKYWIIVDGRPQGPFTPEQLQSRTDFTAALPVWTTGMADWTTAGQVEELAALLGEQPEPVADYVEEEVEQVSRPATEPQEEPQPQPQTQWINPLQQEINGEKRPSTYLAWNIVMTLCCCTPAGVVGIIYSSLVNQRWMRGNVEGAKKASEMAAWWLILSFTLGLVFWPFQMLFQLM